MGAASESAVSESAGASLASARARESSWDAFMVLGAATLIAKAVAVQESRRRAVPLKSGQGWRANPTVGQHGGPRGAMRAASSGSPNTITQRHGRHRRQAQRRQI